MNNTVENESHDPLDIFLEAALMASEGPMTLARLCAIFPEGEQPEREQIKQSLDRLQERYRNRGIQLQQVASGYRFQVNEGITPRLKRLWETKPPRYSRALLETLSIIAYKQPITRGEVEAIRGVSVAGSIMRTLLDNDWVKVVGTREVPGRPALYGTTREFLDHFNLKSLVELPVLPEVSLTHEKLDDSGLENVTDTVEIIDDTLQNAGGGSATEEGDADTSNAGELAEGADKRRSNDNPKDTVTSEMREDTDRAANG